jgi:glycosyltransferase involved in cell wall biosynthesis
VNEEDRAVEPDAPPKTIVVMPAYNAAMTLEDTWKLIPRKIVDEILVVDDASLDATITVANGLGLKVIPHPHNVGYGGNQKTCYMEALRDGATIVVMLHPDGQYDPSLIPDLIAPIQAGEADMVLGSRLATPGSARAGGMPLWKYAANRFLTTVENRVLGQQFSELHTGYRAYSRRFLDTVPFLRNSNDFVFDTEVIVQAVSTGMRIVEVPVSTRYFDDASSIGLRTSVVYGLKTLWTLVRYGLHRSGIHQARFLQPARTVDLRSPAVMPAHDNSNNRSFTRSAT